MSEQPGKKITVAQASGFSQGSLNIKISRKRCYEMSEAAAERSSLKKCS